MALNSLFVPMCR